MILIGRVFQFYHRSALSRLAWLCPGIYDCNIYFLIVFGKFPINTLAGLQRNLCCIIFFRFQTPAGLYQLGSFQRKRIVSTIQYELRCPVIFQLRQNGLIRTAFIAARSCRS